MTIDCNSYIEKRTHKHSIEPSTCESAGSSNQVLCSRELLLVVGLHLGSVIGEHIAIVESLIDRGRDARGQRRKGNEICGTHIGDIVGYFRFVSWL